MLPQECPGPCTGTATSKLSGYGWMQRGCLSWRGERGEERGKERGRRREEREERKDERGERREESRERREERREKREERTTIDSGRFCGCPYTKSRSILGVHIKAPKAWKLPSRTSGMYPWKLPEGKAVQ